MAIRVLSVGFLVEQLLRRHAVLERAGFQVDSASNANEALARIENRRYNAMIIGPAVPEQLRNKLAREARKTNSRLGIIALYSQSIENAEQADAVLWAVTSEQTLPDAIRDILRFGDSVQRKSRRGGK